MVNWIKCENGNIVNLCNIEKFEIIKTSDGLWKVYINIREGEGEVLFSSIDNGQVIDVMNKLDDLLLVLEVL